MELHELEIGERGARAKRSGHPLADRPRRIRRSLPERGCATRREQRRSRGDGAAIRDDSDAAIVVAPDRQHALTLDDLDARVGEHLLGQDARDPVARRRAARMHDPPPAVASLEPEPLVEDDAELDEILDPRGRLVGQDSNRRRPTEPATRTQRVLRMQCGRVVRTDGRCDATLREQARRGEQRALRQHEHVALGRSAERREEPGDASADDDERQLLVSPRIGFDAHAHGSFRL